jgi:hypothetical protein
VDHPQGHHGFEKAWKKGGQVQKKAEFSEAYKKTFKQEIKGDF